MLYSALLPSVITRREARASELCFLVITRRVRPGPSERRLTQPLALPLLPLGAGLEHGAAHRAETRRRAHLRVEERYLQMQG